MPRILTPFGKLFWAGLSVAALAAGWEIWAWLPNPDSRSVLASLTGRVVAIFCVVLLFAGFWRIISNWRSWPLLPNAAGAPPRLPWLRWLCITGLIIAFMGMFLFSAWRVSSPGPWTRYLTAFALALLISLLTDDFTNDISWREMVIALALWVTLGAAAEIQASFPSKVASILAILTGCGFCSGLAYILYGEHRYALAGQLLNWRARSGTARIIVLAIFLLLPLIVRFTFGPSFYAFAPSLRFIALAISFVASTFLLTSDSIRPFSRRAALLSSGILFTIFVINGYTYLVSTYPFSLSWSEGNRLYDYSLIFAPQVYHYSGDISSPYNSPARYALWGLPFLWPDSTIWLNRLWAVVLRILPAFLFGWLVSAGIKETKLRWAIAFWVLLLFVVPSSIYAPILLSGTLVVLFAFQPSLPLRLVVVIVAAAYASLSRWTWSLAPAAWAALIDLFLYYPQRKASLFGKILPTALLAVSGAAAGLAFGQKSLLNYVTSESFVSSQPLLWYRLFPNETYSPGIVLGTLITTGPLIAILFWWMFSRKWRLDWIQWLAIWGTLFGFLATGWIASTKIGGGSNLHNLDIYFISLALIFCMGLYFLQREDQLQWASWPFWIQAMLCWYIVIIAYRFTPFQTEGVPATLQLPPQAHIEQTLETIRTQSMQASRNGEVLFMDQRQLITFGYVTGLPFVPDYEKNYMMDQALASNSRYFKQYYLDLSVKRFSLIVTEPLKLNLKGQNAAPFSEENDSWVRWVSEPTLCFYKPLFTDPDIGVQLLVPRKDLSGCGKYLTGG